MRQAFTMLVLLLMIVGCKTSKKFYGIDIKSGPCKGLNNFLEENWGYDKDRNIYFLKVAEDGTILSKDYWECFLTFNREQVNRILGDPNERHVNHFKYYFDEECFNQESAMSFSYLRVEFNPEGMVTYIGTAGGGWIP